MFFLNALSVDLILDRWALGVACVRTRACPIVRTVVCDLNTELNLVVGAGLRSKCGSAGSDWLRFAGAFIGRWSWLSFEALLTRGVAVVGG